MANPRKGQEQLQNLQLLVESIHWPGDNVIATAVVAAKMANLSAKEEVEQQLHLLWQLEVLQNQ